MPTRRLSIRRLFLWLLMLAVPLQGIAASTMLLCGPTHHHRQAAGEAVHDHAQHHAASAAHAAGHAQADADDAHAAAGGATPGSADVSKSKCSVCASCCSGMALLSTSVPNSMAAPHESYTVCPARDFEPVFISGLKKPPRSTCA